MTTNARKLGTRKRISDQLKIATWNVRGIAQKEIELTKIFEKMNINLAVITETKKKLKGSKYVENYAMFYSGVDQRERAAKGVSIFIDRKWESRIKEVQYINERIIMMKLKHDRGYLIAIGVYAPEEGKKDETEEFYEILQNLLDKYNSKYEVLLVGDFNARVGNQNIPNIVGTHGEKTKNSNGEKLREFAAFNELCISNTLKKKKDIHKYTWAARGSRSVIDYVIGNKRICKQIEDTTVKRGCDINSDHFLVVSRITLLSRWVRGKNNKKSKNNTEEVYKTHLLENESVRSLYQNRVNFHLQEYTTSEDIETEWQNIKSIVKQAGNEAVGQKKKFRKRIGLKIWNEEIEKHVKHKQATYKFFLNNPTENNKEKYREARNKVKSIIKKAHSDSWERFIGRIEHDLFGRQALAFKVMRSLNKNVRENVQINIIEKDRWIKHYKDLWYEEQSETVKIQANADVDNLSIEELQEALKKSKNRKAPGMNGINTEFLKYAGILFHLRLLHFFNMCWKNKQIPKEWRQAKVISLFKKGDRGNPNNYRGISLLDTSYKIYAKIMNERLKIIADHLISEEQMGFRKGRSTTDAIFTLKRIIEERREFNCETHLAFIDLLKAFDNVNRNLLWSILEKRGYPKHLVEAIKSLYEDTSIRLVVGNILTEDIPTNKGVRQGCSLSPTLFNIYMDDMFRTWKLNVDPGIYFKKTFLNSLLYADDKVIIQDSEDKMQMAVYKLHQIAADYGFKVSIEKTKTMAFKGKYPVRTKIVIEGKILEQVKHFKYLGCYVSYEKEIDLDEKLNRFRSICGTIHRNLKNKTRKETRVKFFNTVAIPVLMYGNEIRVMSEKDKSRIQAAEMKFMRSTLGFTILDKKRNTDIRQELKVEPLLDTLRRNRQRWCEHLERMPNTRLPAIARDYRAVGRRDIGRPRAKWAPEQVH